MRLIAPLVVLLCVAAAAFACDAFAGDGERPVAVAGRVVDEGGKPMAGVRVYAGLYELRNSTHTDATGAFALRLQADRIPLFISANGYVQYRREVPNGTRDLEVTMVVGARVRGRLALPEGAAMPATVRILSPRTRGGSQTADVAADGHFEIGGFENGLSRRLGVWAPGFMPLQLQDRTLRVDEPLDLGTLTLGSGRSATVHVRDHEKKPVEGARVRIESSRWSAIQWNRTTDAAGDVRVEAAPGELLRVEVRGPHTDSDRWTASLPPRPGREVETTVVVEHPVTLHGTLVWRGAGPAPWAGEHGIQVSLLTDAASGSSRSWHGLTAGNGSADILIPGCVPGLWANAEIRVAVGQRWSVVRRALTIPRVAKPRGRSELGEIHVPPPAK